MPCQIRKAVATDASAACEVVRRSIEELCVADHRGDPATLSAWLESKTPANSERWIQSERHVAVAADRDAELVGFGLLNLDGYIALLYVAPEARFKGVSKSILGLLEREALAAGIQELKVESSKTALRFYRSAGYTSTGGCVPGFGVTSCYPMSRQLVSSGDPGRISMGDP